MRRVVDLSGLHERYMRGERMVALGREAGLRPYTLYKRFAYAGLPLRDKKLNGPPIKRVEDRFWSRVKKSDSCWAWTGAVTRKGYPRISRPGGGMMLAHRMSWELHYGAIPAGMFVCHSCDNPPCVRPDHLWLGTNADNMRDCSLKGRVRNGFVDDGRWRRKTMSQSTAESMVDSGLSVDDACREHGICSSTYYNILADVRRRREV